jgi:type II secretory pathway pseudopilin PulG
VQKAHHDIKVISSVLELYKLDKFGYPSTEQGLKVLVCYKVANGFAWIQCGFVFLFSNFLPQKV